MLICLLVDTILPGDFDTPCLSVSSAVKRHHNPALLYRKTFRCGGLQLRGSALYHHGGKQSNMQADTMVEKELRVL